MISFRIYMRVAIMTLVAAMGIAGCVCDEVEPVVDYVVVGDRIPQFSVIMSDGQEVTDASLAGYISMIVFFNTGCEDCRAELPVIQRLHEAYPDLHIICIAREETGESIEKYWSRNHMNIPYSPQADRKVFNMFASESIPRIYIVSPNLTVIATFDDTDMPDFNTLATLYLRYAILETV